MFRTVFFLLLLIVGSNAKAQSPDNKDSVIAEIKSLESLKKQLQDKVIHLENSIAEGDTIFLKTKSQDEELALLMADQDRTLKELRETLNSLDTMRNRTKEQGKLLKKLSKALTDLQKSQQELRERTEESRQELDRIGSRRLATKEELERAKELISELETTIEKLKKSM